LTLRTITLLPILALGCSEHGLEGDVELGRGAAALTGEGETTGDDGDGDDGDDGDDDDDSEDPCRTQGYWGTHPDAWPVTELQLGDRTYTAEEADAFLTSDSLGDASAILAAQLVPAELNLASGGDDAILGTVADAHAWIAARDDDGPLLFDIPTSTPEGQEAIDLARLLDEYNNSDCG
jgi:hypothetical protein